MDRLKTRTNGYFQLEEEVGLPAVSRKLMVLMDLIKLESIEERVLPEIIAEYLGGERADIHERSHLMLMLVEKFLSGEKEFSDYSEKLLNCCKNPEEAESIIDDIEELLIELEERGKTFDGVGVDVIRMGIELKEKLREQGKHGLTDQEKRILLEPILMEKTGEVDSAREIIKARVEEALDLIKKNTKVRFFHHDLEKVAEEKEKLKEMKRFAKAKLKKKTESINDDEQLQNP
jgi:hypothetical protein